MPIAKRSVLACPGHKIIRILLGRNAKVLIFSAKEFLNPLLFNGALQVMLSRPVILRVPRL
jgi:hypothetical protein